MPVPTHALEKRLEDIRTLFSHMKSEYDDLMAEHLRSRRQTYSTDAWQIPSQLPHPKHTPEAHPVSPPKRHDPAILQVESVDDDSKVQVPNTVLAPTPGLVQRESLVSIDEEEKLTTDARHASCEEIFEDYLCAKKISERSIPLRDTCREKFASMRRCNEELSSADLYPLTHSASEDLQQCSATTRDTSERKRLFQSAHKPLGANRIGMLSGHSLACRSMGFDHDGSSKSRSVKIFDAAKRAGQSLRHMKTFLSTATEPMVVQVEKSFIFKMVCITAICANTVWVGIQADYETKRRYRNMLGGDESESSGFKIGEYSFTAWFTLELVIRIAATRMDFVHGDDRWWNVCDAFLVLNSYFGMAISLSGGDHPNLQFVRILRVFRLIRVVRVVRHVKALGNLRTLIFSIINSFVNLLWALLVIMLIIFIFSVIFQNAVSNFFSTAETIDEKDQANRIHKEFGTLYRTMTALFCSITGGNDWMMYAELLRSISDIYFLAFGFYIAFAMVGLLNVVTGIFVDSAVCTRTEDEVIETWRSDQKRTETSIRKIFKDADVEEIGHISLEQFEVQLADPRVRAYFAGMDLDAADARSIFRLLDRDRSNRVDINEFVNGTMKLKGHAKQVDMMSLMYDSVRQQIKIGEFCEFVENELLDLRGAIDKLAPVAKPDEAIRNNNRPQMG